MRDLPPGVTIGPPPAELELEESDADYRWYRGGCCGARSPLSAVQEAKAFPERIVVDPPEGLRFAKQFAYSGSVHSSRHSEASEFRALPEMGWEEARIAVSRLFAPVRYGGSGTAREYVALAEFALTAAGLTGFVGRRGDHAVKLRSELGTAIEALRRPLDSRLQAASRNAELLVRPITLHGEDMRDDGSPTRVANSIVCALWTMVPAGAEQWVRVGMATPDQVTAALDYLRATLTAWEARRPMAGTAQSMVTEGSVTPADVPAAAAYAEALRIADKLVFAGEKLPAVYAGIMSRCPFYRMYPATCEHEASALWWPWGRAAPLVDGGPPRPPKPGKQVLDPAIIRATRPQHVVREITEKAGINRTTAQRMTASMRSRMRRERRNRAELLLREGLTKAEVERTVGLSASRISALFKGKVFPAKRGRRAAAPSAGRLEDAGAAQ